ncbi:MAG: Gfo/Idh/MocA family oxidoreductase [Bryobacterales bacterium]|nr:Gfo/Idh/MocA family oxidoreductase [Bryobacterales bacterium]
MQSQKHSALLSRRNFVVTTGATLAAASSGAASQSSKRLRLALVGTGMRGTLTWGIPVAKNYSDVVEFVGLCDINSKRVKMSREMIGVNVPVFTDFDEMVKTTRPDAVMITTICATHYRYIVRSLELGVHPITEKAMCTDEQQCQAILDAQRRSGRNVTVTFNARHGVEDKKVKQLLMERAVGDVIAVDFHEYLNTSHGADYFRRWHRLKENSGTLLVHKACHHFDQANWWLESDPVEVSAWGQLKYYGHNNSFRGTHCRACPYRKQCKLYYDVTKNPQFVKLYVDCESEDGYLRDGCVWAESTNIYDSMSVRVRYRNGVILTYTANTYQPYEGQSISFMGNKGRLDYQTFGGGGHKVSEVRLTRTFGKSEIVPMTEQARAGEHGGADAGIRDLVFRNLPNPDPLSLRAGMRAGALSSLIGIAAYRSIEQNGRLVRINDLVKL